MLGNILVTSSSSKTPLICALQDAVRRINPNSKVIAGDINPNCVTRYVADMFWEMPPLTEESYDRILAYCLSENVTVIFPTRDGELTYWSKHSKDFEKYNIHVLVSSLESITLCLDKLLFSHFGEIQNLPIIPSYLSPNSTISNRWVVKERFGAGSKNIGINLSISEALTVATRLNNPIYQPYVDGVEISVDGWMSKSHNLKGLILRTRDSVANGESEITTTFQDKTIEIQVSEVLQKLQISGHVVLQAIITNNGLIKIIECNSRFGGASTASIKSGLDSIYWSLLETIGVNVSEIPFERIPYDIKQIRIKSDRYVIV